MRHLKNLQVFARNSKIRKKLISCSLEANMEEAVEEPKEKLCENVKHDEESELVYEKEKTKTKSEKERIVQDKKEASVKREKINEPERMKRPVRWTHAKKERKWIRKVCS